MSKENFDDVNNGDAHPAGDSATPEAFAGPLGYGEVQYSMNGEAINPETLGQFSPDGQTEYFSTGGADEFPLSARLREATSAEAYPKLTADIEAFYVAQIEALEGPNPPTCADAEVVEFASMLSERTAETAKESDQLEKITTTEDATAYLRRPGVMEGVSAKARKLLAIAFSATAFAAAPPASAQQGWDLMMGQYIVSRGVQEVQGGMGMSMQMEQIKSRCDAEIQSLEHALQFQIDNLQMQGVHLDGIALLNPEAPRQFQENNPHATREQITGFTQVRQTALQNKMKMKQITARCDMQMRQLSRGASYAREGRIINDVGNVIIQSIRIPRETGR